MEQQINNTSVIGDADRKWRFTGWWEHQTGKPFGKKDKILLGVFLIVFLFVFYIVLDANKYKAQVLVIEGTGRVGVNPTTESLDFGDLSRGGTAVRRVKIENKTFIPMQVIVFSLGSISSLMKMNDEFFRLAPESEAKVEFTIYMPASAEIDRTYSGRVYLFKIPRF